MSKLCDLSDDCGDFTDEQVPDCDDAIPENFESGQDGDETNIGIFTQDSPEADFLWKRGSGRSLPSSTGPPFDHTYFAPNGHYAFIRSTEQNKDEVARLVSPALEVTGEPCRITVWYYMHGEGVGKLFLRIM